MGQGRGRIFVALPTIGTRLSRFLPAQEYAPADNSCPAIHPGLRSRLRVAQAALRPGLSLFRTFGALKVSRFEQRLRDAASSVFERCGCTSSPHTNPANSGDAGKMCPSRGVSHVSARLTPSRRGRKRKPCLADCHCPTHVFAQGASSCYASFSGLGLPHRR